MATMPTVTRSTEMLNRSESLMIQGCQSHKRNRMMLDRGFPVFTKSAKGPRFTDVDGQDYLDYLLGFGPIILGHADDGVIQAVAEQSQQGTIFSTAHERELAVAERVLSYFPWAGRIGFVLGGSAATSAAIRLARAYTGRDLVLRCGYHGWHDWTSPSPDGVPTSERANALPFPYGDLTALKAQLEEHSAGVACVIVETLQEGGSDAAYLQGCIDLAHEHGALCIFDEVKTGCRVAYGGISELYGLTPDLATYGKAWCNGFPAAFVVGREEILGDERCGNCWLAATFHCELASFAALDVVLDRLAAEDGLAHQHRLGERFIAGINQACAQHGVPYRLVGHPAMPQPVISENKPLVIRMLQGVMARGHYVHPGHCMFFSLSHSMDDIESTIAAVEAACKEL